jgi:hypothetical protein
MASVLVFLLVVVVSAAQLYMQSAVGASAHSTTLAPTPTLGMTSSAGRC